MKICVYCGSSLGKHKTYKDAAILLGETLVKHEIDLVYGGAKVGLMGMLADEVLDNGGKVIGVIPKNFDEKELAHPSLTELHIVNSMHERKSLYEELSDGFIAMPGGPGTLEEMCEIWTWGQIGFHKKPCGFYNVSGYFDHLLEFIDHMVVSGFMKPKYREMLQIENNPDKLIEKMKNYSPPMPKWEENTR
jgi:uncharacterized protein (TIGR00730 family)